MKLLAYCLRSGPSRCENQSGEAEIASFLPRRPFPSAAKVCMKKRSAVPAWPTGMASNSVGREAKTCVGRKGFPQQKSSELP